jgi:D-amino peptidase
MNVYIAMDMEGISGISNGGMLRTGHPDWASRGRHLATTEVNAAIEGALAAGAKRIWVEDAHDIGENLLREELHKAAELISKPGAVTGLMPGIGFHARAGTRRAYLDHTWSTACIREVRLNNTVVGEIGIFAAYAGFFGVPVVLVTGTAAATREAIELLGNVVTVAVKEGYGRFSVRVLSPEETLPRVRVAAEKALKAGGHPWKLQTPLNVAVDFLRSAEADMAEMIPGAQRTGPRTVEYSHETPDLAFKALQAMITLGGVAANRWARALYTR